MCAPHQTNPVEHPEVKTFSLHPGMVATELVENAKLIGSGIDFSDTPDLAAATMLYITSGKADWLSGRYELCCSIIFVN